MNKTWIAMDDFNHKIPINHDYGIIMAIDSFIT
jgi:hypothetical protein